MPSTPTVVRSASLSGYVELASSLGLQPMDMLRAAGLDPCCLQDPETPIPAQAVRELLESSAQAARAEDFGLQLAHGRRLSNLGSIGLVLQEEPTARQALNTLTRYLRLLNTSLLTRVEDHGEVVLIREEFLMNDSRSVRQAMELAIGVMYQILVELLGPGWRPRRVCFNHRPPRDMGTHQALFECELEFNSSFSGIVCAAKDLAVGLHRPASGMASQVKGVLEQTLGNTRTSTAHVVRQLVTALLPGGRCTAEEVARHLGVDRRTLHRHLRMEDTRFFLLLQEVRGQFALRQIRDSDRALAELADLLGFSSSSAFAFWFKRKYGCTVSAWKQAQAVGATAS